MHHRLIILHVGSELSSCIISLILHTTPTSITSPIWPFPSDFTSTLFIYCDRLFRVYPFTVKNYRSDVILFFSRAGPNV